MTLSKKYNAGNESILTAQTELVKDITNALMIDKRTKNAVIEVINERGFITLTGTVDDRQSREAAQEIAAAQPGVVSVANGLKVSA